MRRLIGVAVLCAVAVPLAAPKIDPRLSTAKKAFVEPVDPLDDDRLVATCLAERLSTVTPMESVATKDEADIVLLVKAHITSGTARVVLGMMGGTPSANLEAQLPDGKSLWSDGAKYRKGNGAIGVAAAGPACGLANNLLNTLLDAMKKAQDGK